MSKYKKPNELVIIESPYAGRTEQHRRLNVLYARAALAHSLSEGEAPIASHLLYTQVLDDKDPGHRRLGIDAGLAWRGAADRAVFYVDLGMSRGMDAAKREHERTGLVIEVRTIDNWPLYLTPNYLEGEH